MNGKIYGFRLRFSLKPLHLDTVSEESRLADFNGPIWDGETLQIFKSPSANGTRPRKAAHKTHPPGDLGGSNLALAGLFTAKDGNDEVCCHTPGAPRASIAACRQMS